MLPTPKASSRRSLKVRLALRKLFGLSYGLLEYSATQDLLFFTFRKIKQMKPVLERIGRIIKRWCRVKLDGGSWLETEGPGEDWYCEPTRKLLFRWEVIDRDRVRVHLDLMAVWQSSKGSHPVTASELAAISPKLQKYFEREFGHSSVVIQNG